MLKCSLPGSTLACRRVTKRVFNIDIEQCERCGGHVKVVSSIEDPAVIEKILAHLALQEPSLITGPVEARAPPFQLGKFNNF